MPACRVVEDVPHVTRQSVSSTLPGSLSLSMWWSTAVKSYRVRLVMHCILKTRAGRAACRIWGSPLNFSVPGPAELLTLACMPYALSPGPDCYLQADVTSSVISMTVLKTGVPSGDLSGCVVPLAHAAAPYEPEQLLDTGPHSQQPPLIEFPSTFMLDFRFICQKYKQNQTA